MKCGKSRAAWWDQWHRAPAARRSCRNNWPETRLRSGHGFSRRRRRNPAPLRRDGCCCCDRIVHRLERKCRHDHHDPNTSGLMRRRRHGGRQTASHALPDSRHCRTNHRSRGRRRGRSWKDRSGVDRCLGRRGNQHRRHHHCGRTITSPGQRWFRGILAPLDAAHTTSATSRLRNSKYACCAQHRLLLNYRTKILTF